MKKANLPLPIQFAKLACLSRWYTVLLLLFTSFLVERERENSIITSASGFIGGDMYEY